MAATIWAAGAAIVALGLAQVIGNLVDRARPYDAIAELYDPWSRTVVEDVDFYREEAGAAGKAGGPAP